MVHPVDGPHQFFWAGILQEIAQRARLDGREDLVVSGKAGQHQDTCFRLTGRDAANGLNPIHLRHHQVHQDDVGLEPFCLGHRLPPVFCLSHHFNVRLRRQQGTNPLADYDVIVGH